MRSQLINVKGNFSTSWRIEPWSPGIENHSATKELCWHLKTLLFWQIVRQGLVLCQYNTHNLWYTTFFVFPNFLTINELYLKTIAKLYLGVYSFFFAFILPLAKYFVVLHWIFATLNLDTSFKCPGYWSLDICLLHYLYLILFKN